MSELVDNVKKEGNIKVIIALFILMGMQPTIISKTISSFMTPLNNVAGVSTTAFSTMIAIAGLLSAFLSPMTGKCLNKFGVKRFMLICAVVTTACYFGISCVTASTSWLLYVIGVFDGAFMIGLSQVVFSTIVTSWYQGKNKGTMLGIVMAGSNVFNFIFTNVTGFALTQYGNEFYRSLMNIYTVIMLVVSIPLILFVVKMNPKFDPNKKDENGNESNNSIPGMTMKEARKTSIFWLFCLALVFLGIVVTGIQMHIINFFQVECGANASSANGIWSIAAPCAVASNILMGYAFGKFGPKKTVLVTAVGWVAMIICLIFAPNNMTFGIVGVSIYGCFGAICTVGPSYLTNIMFGQKEYATIYGFIMMMFLIGATLGSVITSIVANAASYQVMWIIDLCLIVIAFITFTYAIIKNKDNIEANS